MSAYPNRVIPAYKTEISELLDSFKFDRFLTLATNNPCLPLMGHRSMSDRLRDLVRERDARINRKLVGPQWLERPEDRIWAFYFLEKPQSNPHWHALVRFHPPHPGHEKKMASLFDLHSEPIWKKLVPTGTAVSLPLLYERGVTKYVAKSLPYPVCYEHYITPDEFK